MKKFTLNLKIGLGVMLCGIFMAFSLGIGLAEETAFIQKMLKEHYNEAPVNPAIKRYELNVTNTGFCRYKRFFTSGKVEYFSFNLVKFKDLDYYGTDKKGELYLRTKGDDVIVQTYNDKKGDVDSMASYLSIPLKNIEPQDLSDLLEKLTKMNAQLVLVQK
ncbi:hypothetical protein [Pedobacter metabolipauper]|uniref:Uncharacterized protein n=1 Tax=Pedobacter metabolipauper TaxID=425513 RepID=A0A4R6STW0_9SPHI|nr:hypothetical protein [Pedobacter metabolipauper]TDQ07504.1 hypothetical protein ATK78_3631 [Pedobacter metabolipauper]